MTPRLECKLSVGKRLLSVRVAVLISFAGPPWLDSQRFDIVAKLPPGANADQFPAMMQTLLRERFKLVVHRESKIMTALALLVDKNGLRINPVEAGPSSTSWGRTMVNASKVSIAQ